MAAADSANCATGMAQTERHIVQTAYAEGDSPWDDGYDSGWYDDEDEWDDDDDDDSTEQESKETNNARVYELGEVFEDELQVTHVVSHSKQYRLPKQLLLDPQYIVSKLPVEEWKPTKEEYEGYTGNAGNTLARWYRRSVLLVWSRDHHFRILAINDPEAVLSLINKKWEESKKTKVADGPARAEVKRMLLDLIEVWSSRNFTPEVLTLYVELEDVDLLKRLLNASKEHLQDLDIRPVLKSAIKRYGLGPLFSILKDVFQCSKDKGKLPPRSIRNIVCLSAIASNTVDVQDKQLAAELADLAADHLLLELATGPYRVSEKAVIETSTLITSLIQLDYHHRLPHIIDAFEKQPELSSLEPHCNVVKQVVDFCKKSGLALPSEFKNWIKRIQDRLEASTSDQPTPPKDNARMPTPCRCSICKSINAFLTNPVLPGSRMLIPRTEHQHVLSIISAHQIDVTAREYQEQVGKRNRYGLEFKKTTASFQKALKEFERDRKLLDSLRSMSERA